MEQLSQLPLFEGMNDNDCFQMLSCFRTSPRTFKAGETAYTYGTGNGKNLGIIQEGQAVLVKIDAGGSRTVLERLGKVVRCKERVHSQRAHHRLDAPG